jgi:hypothetical protein
MGVALQISRDVPARLVFPLDELIYGEEAGFPIQRRANVLS